MKKLLILLLSIVCMFCFAVGCKKPEDPKPEPKFVENKEQIVQQFNGGLESLKTATIVKGSDLNFADEANALWAELGKINKVITLGFATMSNDPTGLDDIEFDEPNEVSVALMKDQVELFINDNDGATIFNDGTGLYVTRAGEGDGETEMVFYLPYDYLMTKIGLEADDVIDVPTLSERFLGDAEAIAGYIDLFPRLTVEDIEYVSATQEHVIKPEYVKEVVGAILEEVIPDDVDDKATIKIAASGIVDELGLTIAVKYRDDNKKDYRVTLEPTDDFFDTVFGMLLGGEPTERPISDFKLEVLVKETTSEASFLLDVKGPQDASIELALGAKAAPADIGVTADVDVFIPLSVEEDEVVAIEGCLHASLKSDGKDVLNGALDVDFNYADTIILDAGATLAKTDKAIDVDVTLTQFAMVAEDMPVNGMDITANLAADADLTNGAFTVTGAMNFSEIDYVDGENEKIGLFVIGADASLTGNLRDLAGKADKVVLDGEINIEFGEKVIDFDGEEVETDMGEMSFYVDAKNVADGKTEILISGASKYEDDDEVEYGGYLLTFAVAEITDAYEGLLPAANKAKIIANKDNLLIDYWMEDEYPFAEDAIEGLKAQIEAGNYTKPTVVGHYPTLITKVSDGIYVAVNSFVNTNGEIIVYDSYQYIIFAEKDSDLHTDGNYYIYVAPPQA